MTLTDEQKSAVTGWIESGLGLSEVQTKLREDFGVTLTYMETRFLVDDLRLTLKSDPEPEPEPAVENSAEPDVLPSDPFDDELPAAGGGKVSVSIDQIARPSAMISGKVTFSDGQAASWSIDQMGRLGLDPDTPGYRPTEADVMQFQVELQRLARSQGY